MPALKSVSPASPGNKWGQVSLVDTVVEYPSFADAARCVAFDTVHSLYLRDVYVKHCATLVAAPCVRPELEAGEPPPGGGREASAKGFGLRWAASRRVGLGGARSGVSVSGRA